MTKFTPKEIYLLEKFSSLEYLAELRDVWGEMIKHLESCLEKYMASLPSNYRRLPLPEQPDSVWGERVLPNFRSSYDALVSAVISMSHGDMRALRAANGPFNDYKGQGDYSTDWMSKVDADRYFDLLCRANTMAGNICATEEPYWRPGTLNAYDSYRSAIEISDSFPEYRLSVGTTTKTSETVRRAGIYVPDLEGSCAEYLNSYNDAPAAIVQHGKRDLFHPSTGEKYGEQPIYQDLPCSWTLVERVPSASSSSPRQTALVE